MSAFVAHRQDLNGAVDFIERERLVGAGDHDGVVLRRRLLGKGQAEEEWDQWEDSEAQRPFYRRGMQNF